MGASGNEFVWEGVAEFDVSEEGGELLELGFSFNEHRVFEENAERQVQLELKREEEVFKQKLLAKSRLVFGSCAHRAEQTA